MAIHARMDRGALFWCSIALASALPLLSSAASLDEVVVTGSYRNEKDLPGSYLKRRGDHMLLTVTVTNDTREEPARKSEIYETLKNAVEAASKQNGLELSVFDARGNLIGLTRENYQVQLAKGARPDSSVASIRVKMKIPEADSDSDRMTLEMLKFVQQVKTSGRTTLEPSSSVDITLIDPNQYRAQIVEKFSQEVALVMKALGPDYRLVLYGIDKPVKFSRIGPLEVALYIPYNFHIVPTSISAISD